MPKKITSEVFIEKAKNVHDGLYDYSKVEYIHGDIDLIQKRDKIKDKYAKHKNMKLIRIPYWEKDNLEMIIVDNISKESK